ncbi:hypothetical protein [Spirosoma flavum]|uniref:HNH endonuclease n=1 Tax=Spirosoma flavum TaxID=2048557 RepID=A0ABW6ANZ5_9BACT
MASYQQQLESPEWKKKRLEILQEREWICRDCSNQRYIQVFPLVKPFSMRSTPRPSYSYATLLVGDQDKIPISAVSSVYNAISNIPKRLSREYSKKGMLCYKKNDNDSFEIFAVFVFNQNVDKEASLNNPEFQDSYFKSLKDFGNKDITWHYIKGINVHHEYYIQNTQIWNQPNNSFTVLCKDCHEDLHKNNPETPVRDKNGNFLYMHTISTAH